MTAHTASRRARFTVLEALTALTVAAVLAAIAIPTWRTHQLRTRRADAIAALLAVQKAQDLHFGTQARYANREQLTAPAPAGLGGKAMSDRGFYRLELRVSDDALSYTAIALAQGAVDDSRCVEFSIDHNGLRRALDATGEDRTADCWR